jgi:TfoX/Sxy family transcriptional regulator of competence genes
MVRTRDDSHEVVHSAILAMPQVTAKRMFGADAYFTAGRMFAFLFEQSIVLKLPEADRQDALDTRVARPFLTDEEAPFGRWVETAIMGTDALGRAIRLAAAAHALAASPHHDGPRKRRPGVRRRASRARRSPQS